MKYTTRLNLGVELVVEWFWHRRPLSLHKWSRYTCKLYNIDHACRSFIHTYESWVIFFLHWSLPMACFRGCTWPGSVRCWVFVPFILHVLQVCQPCISLHIIHGSQIQKFTAVGRGILGMHATCWLASVLIVFLKRLADLTTNELLYYSYMDKIHFST